LCFLFVCALSWSFESFSIFRGYSYFVVFVAFRCDGFLCHCISAIHNDFFIEKNHCVFFFCTMSLVQADGYKTIFFICFWFYVGEESCFLFMLYEIWWPTHSHYRRRLKHEDNVFRSYSYFQVCCCVLLWWSFLLLGFCKSQWFLWWKGIIVLSFLVWCYWLWNLLTNKVTKWKQWEGIYREEGGRSWCIKLLVH
jgi:hypothetical protein